MIIPIFNVSKHKKRSVPLNENSKNSKLGSTLKLNNRKTVNHKKMNIVS